MSVPTTSTSISIHPATPSDAASTVDLDLAAFATNPFMQRTWNIAAATTPSQLAAFRAWRTEMVKLRTTGSGKHYFKAVDDANGGEMVGCAGFYAPEGFDLEANWRSTVAVPDFVDLAGQEEYREKSKAAKERWVGERRDVWFVQAMTVSPSHWGKGLGKRLLKRGLEEVDKAGQDIYLEATPAAVGLYKSCGFEELEDLALFGGEYVLKIMMRPRKRAGVPTPP